MSYTGADVRREAGAYREWARQRDREQFHAVTRARMQAQYELKHQDLKVRKTK